MVRLPHLLALLCGFAVALAVGCGDRSNLIPSSRASELVAQLTSLQADIANGQCDGLAGRVDAFHDDATTLGSAVDKRLRSRIRQGATSLGKHAVRDCQAAADAAQQQAEPEPSDTTPPDTETGTTTTETQTDTVPTTSTPTTTTPATTTPTVPAEPSSAEPGDTGGTSDDDGEVTIP